MRTIGVVDLMNGTAVHARGGRRRDYAPVTRCANTPVPHGDAVALASAYRTLGVRELYVADLDAIVSGQPQDPLVARVADLGMPVWLDAGITSAERARDVERLGVRHVVVGLETLISFEALDAICGVTHEGSVAFSLDLKDGRPLAHAGLRDRSPGQLAARAAKAGAGAIIVLDLARVGTGAGLDLALIERVRSAAPDVMLVAGGGVRGTEDLEALAAAGCDGALVATALLEGRLDFRVRS